MRISVELCSLSSIFVTFCVRVFGGLLLCSFLLEHRRIQLAIQRAYALSTLSFGTSQHLAGCCRVCLYGLWPFAPRGHRISTFQPSSITVHVTRFLRDSLSASNILYNGLHLFGGNCGHADQPDPAKAIERSADSS